jgi:hypothetical protein
MPASRFAKLILPAAAALTLGGCGGYGYGGVDIGYGGYNSYYDDDYYGYYSSQPYWGWYNGYYYPGTGVYVYDRYNRRIPWNAYQRSYWLGRQNYWRARPDWSNRGFRDNWRGYRQDGRQWQGRDNDRRDWRGRGDGRRDGRRGRRD